MSKFGNKKYILGTVIFVVLSISFIKSSFNVLKSKDRLDRINDEISLLEQSKNEIEKDIEYRKSDEYIEERARDDLNLIKPGEKVYVVVGGEGDENSSKVLSESDVREGAGEKDKNWYSWYKLFFDN